MKNVKSIDITLDDGTKHTLNTGAIVTVSPQQTDIYMLNLNKQDITQLAFCLINGVHQLGLDNDLIALMDSTPLQNN